MAATKRRPFAFRLPAEGSLRPRKHAQQDRARATVGAIHEAALQVLNEVGFDRLTTTLVAERAGVSVGTLYQYYGDKQALVNALVLEYLGRIEAALRQLLEEPRDLRTLARHFVRRFIAFKLENRLHGLALRTVLVLAGARGAMTAATNVLNAVLEDRIAAAHPTWRKGRAREIAMMWSAVVVGGVGEMLDRSPATIAEPWFCDALEEAVLAMLTP